ncbi:MAG: SAM-dependent chlorinase/fluorinase [Deltaproteobacteria bacterium]|nr:SAM-dependent chlorinase/fluorinase [Deltaproteobacteria bacterium]
MSPQDIQEGAFVFYQAYSFFPRDTIHIAVVDPGVGTKRRPILIEAYWYTFIGPDNGIFSLALKLKRERIKRAIHLTNRGYFLTEEISTTFHGRDIFAPVAAHLSLGIDPSMMGRRIKTIKRPSWGRPIIKKGEVHGRVIHIDRFGNLIPYLDTRLNSRHSRVRPFEIRIGGITINRLFPTYGYARKGEIIALIGSSGLLEVAQREGNATEILNLKNGAPVTILKTKN